jgi:hypothetical protein
MGSVKRRCGEAVPKSLGKPVGQNARRRGTFYLSEERNNLSKEEGQSTKNSQRSHAIDNRAA